MHGETKRAFNDAVGAVRQRRCQSLERCDAPKTEKGKAVWKRSRRLTFEDAPEVIGGIQEVLMFYTAQYDALQRL